MDPAKNVLVTGANGMIGSRLTEHLLARNFRVSHLVRSPQNEGGIPTFRWDPDKKYMDGHALQNVDAIIHLAGAGIADKRWSARRKMEIMESRTRSGQLIFDALKERGGNVSVVISASGTSYYGLKDPGRPFVETDPPGDDFMAGVTVAWENQADAFGQLGLRVVKIRTGPALSPDSIALRRISLPVKLFAGASLGSGQQYFNWIHLDDLCRMYIKAIEDVSMQGAYNGVAPEPVTNKVLTEQIAKALRRPLWLPPVPAFAVKLIAGEVADVVLHGGSISAAKIQAAGFSFQYPNITGALQEILGRARRT